MELEGSLRTFGLPEVLGFFSKGKQTGVLYVQSGDQSVSVHMKEGRIVHSSTLNRTRKLGRILARMGLVKRSDIEAVLREQRSGGDNTPLGEALVKRNLISSDGLREAVRKQLEEDVLDIFLWDEGIFRFEQGSQKLMYQIVGVELDAEPVVDEGLRRRAEWGELRAKIPSESVLLVPRSPQPGERANIKISKEEWSVFALVNGALSVRSLVDRSHVGHFETLRMLSSLLDLGLIAQKMPVSESFSGVEVAVASVASDPDAQSDKEKKRKGFGFLARFTSDSRDESDSPDEPTSLEYESPIAMVTEFANRVFLQMLSAKASRRDGAELGYLAHEWKEILAGYPRADLVVSPDGLLSSVLFDRWLAKMGEHKALVGCYEDALGALAQLISRLRARAIDRMGAEAAERMIKGQVELYNGARSKALKTFDLGAFLKRALAA